MTGHEAGIWWAGALSANRGLRMEDRELRKLTAEVCAPDQLRDICRLFLREFIQ